MRINVTQQLVGYDGDPVKGPVGPLTLREVLCQSLVNQIDSDKEENDANRKFDRWQLAGLIHREEFVDLKAEQVAELKARVAVGWPPIVLGPVWTLIDPPQGDQVSDQACTPLGRTLGLTYAAGHWSPLPSRPMAVRISCSNARRASSSTGLM